MPRVVAGAAAALLSLAALLLGGSPSRAEGTAQAARDPGGSASSGRANFPEFELPVPEVDAERRYLGLSGTGTFRLGQVGAKILIIEIFSFYCPHCQRAAPRVNELYAEIQVRPDLKDTVKLIGIGIGNTRYEVNELRDNYTVPFPLFPDPDRDISDRLGIRFTPTFIGVELKEGSSPAQFYFSIGGFEDARKFLDEIVKLARSE